MLIDKTNTKKKEDTNRVHRCQNPEFSRFVVKDIEGGLYPTLDILNRKT